MTSPPVTKQHATHPTCQLLPQLLRRRLCRGLRLLSRRACCRPLAGHLRLQLLRAPPSLLLRLCNAGGANGRRWVGGRLGAALAGQRADSKRRTRA